MRAALLVAFVLVLSAGAVQSAPAPLPRRDVRECEVVFDAGTDYRVRLVKYFCTSSALADALLQSSLVRNNLPNLEDDDQRRAWLKKRLRVSFRDEPLIRVRFEGPIGLLRGVAGVLAGTGIAGAVFLRDEMMARARAMINIRTKMRGCVTDDDLIETYGQAARYELKMKPLTVRQAPRYVGPAR